MPVLRDLLEKSLDGEWGKSDAESGMVPMRVIRGTDFESVDKGKFDDVPVRFIKESTADRKTLQEGDILLEVAGGSKGRPTGRSLYLDESHLSGSDLPLTCASFSRFIRIDPVLAEPEYVFWLLQALYVDETLAKYNTQHTGVSRFQWTVFADNEDLPLPSRSTQKRVAGVLSDYRSLLANNTRRIEILEEMARAVYREWFVEFRYPGHEGVPLVESDLGPVPDGWRAAPFADLAEFINGFAFGPDHWGEVGLPIIKIKELKNGVTEGTPRYHGDDIKPKYFINDGDILFSWSGDLNAYIWNGGDGLLNQHLFNVLPGDGIERLFLFHALKQSMVEFQARSGGTTMHHIKRSALREVSTPVPPSTVQSVFGDAVGPLDELVLNLHYQNESLRLTRDLLLPRLVSGRIDVSNLDLTEVA